MTVKEVEEQIIKKIESELGKRGFDATNSDFGIIVKHAKETLIVNLNNYEDKKFDTESDLLKFVSNEIDKAIDSYLYESYGQA